MFRKRMIAIITAIGMSGLVACTPNATTKPQESVTPQETTTVNNDESTSVEEGTSAEYDNTSDVYRGVNVEDICKNITINGEQVNFPWTLNSLGEGYEFGSYEVDEETKFGAALLTYKGKRVDIVQIKENGDKVSESLVVKITAERNNTIKLYDFDYEMDEKDVIERLGQPNEIGYDEYYYYIYYKTPDILIKMRFWKENEKLSSYTLEWTDKYINEENE